MPPLTNYFKQLEEQEKAKLTGKTTPAKTQAAHIPQKSAAAHIPQKSAAVKSTSPAPHVLTASPKSASVEVPIQVEGPNGPLEAEITLAISVLAGTPGLVIDASGVPSTCTVGEAYSGQLAVSGGVAPYVWALIDGSLPDGITMDDTGLFSGIPAPDSLTGGDGSGNYAPVIQVTDSTTV